MITAREYLIQRYESIKQYVSEGYDEDTLEKNKARNYLITTISIGKLLEEYTIHSSEEVDKQRRLNAWQDVLDDLIANSILYGVKPKVHINEGGYGYNNFDFMKDEQMVLQFMEGYLIAQRPKYDPIWWLECGVKLNLININLI